MATERLLVVVSAATKGAVKNIEEIALASTKADASIKGLSKTLTKSLVAGAGTLVGVSLVKFLGDAVDGFGDAAKAANDLANASGSTVDTISRMTAALEDAGVSADESAGMLTKFTINVGKHQELLDKLGVTMTRNRDGTVDYAQTMVQVVDAIGRVGDAGARSQNLVALFGKTGARAFQDLLNSGVKLSDAMAAISKYRVFTPDDVAKAVAYDDAMDSLNASIQGLEFSLGRALIPAISDIAGMFADVVDVVSPFVEVLASIPVEAYALAAAVTAVSVAIKKGLVVSLADAAAAMVYYTAVSVMANGVMGTLAVGIQMATAAMLASPIGIFVGALALVAGVFAGIGESSKQAQKRIEALSEAFDAASGKFVTTKQNVDALNDALTGGGINSVQPMIENLGFTMEDLRTAVLGTDEEWQAWEQGVLAAAEASGMSAQAIGVLQSQLDGSRATTTAAQQAAEDHANSLKNVTEITDEATDATAQLKETVAEYIQAQQGVAGAASTWADVAQAAEAANSALLDQARLANAAEAAMGLYAQSVQQAAEFQDKLVQRRGDVQDALSGLTDAVKGLTDPDTGRQVKDLPGTFQDEWEQAKTGVEQSLWDVIKAMAEVGLSGDQINQKLQDMGLLDNLPADARKNVQAAMDEIAGLPTEQVMDFVIKPKIDWGTSGAGSFAEFIRQKEEDLGLNAGDLGRDPTQIARLMEQYTEQLTGQLAPVSQDVKVKLDEGSVEDVKAQTAAAFNTPIDATITPNVVLPDDAVQLADVPLTVVPAADETAMQTVRGTLENTLGPTISPPVVPDVQDTQARTDLDALTRQRTVSIEVQYVDGNGNPIDPTKVGQGALPIPSPRSGGTSAAATSQTTYGPTYNLQGEIRVEAQDTSAFAADLQRQTRRRRLVGLPA